jgi:hypothetical protein
MERLKFLSPDRKHLYKFEGMGPIGDETRARSFTLATAGFGPKVRENSGGFLSYSVVPGTPMDPANISTVLLDRIADYCVFRRNEFPAPQYEAPSQLREMVQFNIAQEFGIELSFTDEAYCSERLVIADGRMQPFEWITEASGNYIKTDGTDHGDNHFFPGPCDITWDLAGASVEWKLDEAATEYLLSRFRRHAGLDVSGDFALYKLAYLVFRLGFCKMAISTVKGSTDEQLLWDAYQNYRDGAQALLEQRPQVQVDSVIT